MLIFWVRLVGGWGTEDKEWVDVQLEVYSPQALLKHVFMITRFVGFQPPLPSGALLTTLALSTLS